jgi:hypothetical protein
MGSCSKLANMTNKNFKIGQRVSYVNGGLSIYTGTIKAINGKELVIIDNDDYSALYLWNKGYAVGSCINVKQIIK